MEILSPFWVATTATFVAGSTATATGPKPVGKGPVRRFSADGSITERVLFAGFTVTATLVSGLNAAPTLPVSAAPVVPVPTRKTSDDTVWSSRLKNDTTPFDAPFGEGSTRIA